MLPFLGLIRGATDSVSEIALRKVRHFVGYLVVIRSGDLAAIATRYPVFELRLIHLPGSIWVSPKSVDKYM